MKEKKKEILIKNIKKILKTRTFRDEEFFINKLKELEDGI